MSQLLSFEEYVQNELKNEDIKNKELEYDDYSIVIEVDYTIQD